MDDNNSPGGRLPATNYQNRIHELLEVRAEALGSSEYNSYRVASDELFEIWQRMHQETADGEGDEQRRRAFSALSAMRHDALCRGDKHAFDVASKALFELCYKQHEHRTALPEKWIRVLLRQAKLHQNPPAWLAPIVDDKRL